MKPNSITIRRRTPEGTAFTTICYDVDSNQPNLMLVNIGKAGSRLNAAADWGARLAGAALRTGADPERVAEITAEITHESSNGDYEAASLADAVAQSLEEFVEEVQDET